MLLWLSAHRCKCSFRQYQGEQLPSPLESQGALQALGLNQKPGQVPLLYKRQVLTPAQPIQGLVWEHLSQSTMDGGHTEAGGGHCYLTWQLHPHTSGACAIKGLSPLVILSLLNLGLIFPFLLTLGLERIPPFLKSLLPLAVCFPSQLLVIEVACACCFFSLTPQLPN